MRKEEDQNFVRISVAAIGGLAGNDDADFAVFLPSPNSTGPVLYRRAGADLAEPDYSRLREHGLGHLLIRSDDLFKCETVLESKLETILSHKAFTPTEKARLVHQVGAAVARDLATADDAAVNVERASQVVDNVIKAVLNDPRVAEHMLSMAGHERTVASHMFMVSSLAIMLGAEVYGPDQEVLNALGLAGMLHDLGKLGIPSEILTKQTPLTAEEIRLIEQHPIEAVRMLTGDPHVTPLVRQMILQHHERVDGRGYPLGVSGTDLHHGSRLLAIVDSFHAMIGRRSYRSAMTPFDATRAIAALAGSQFDPDLARAWSELFTRSWRTEASMNASSDGAAHESGSRNEHRAAATTRAIQSHRVKRFQIKKNAAVQCVYAGRLEHASGAPDVFMASVHDISRGGVCLCTLHPMFRGEMLNIRITPGDDATWVRGTVAWCRKADATMFKVGIRFLQRLAEHESMTKTSMLEMAEIVPTVAARPTGQNSTTTERAGASAIPTPFAQSGISESKVAESLVVLNDIANMNRIPLEAERTVIALSTSTSFKVREKSVAVLAKMKSRAAKDAIVALLHDRDDSVRATAAGVAGGMQIAESYGPLRSMLTDASPMVALRAAGALGCLGDRSGLPLVTKHLERAGDEARLAAVAFGQIVGQRFLGNAEGVSSARRYLTLHPSHDVPGVTPKRSAPSTPRTHRPGSKPGSSHGHKPHAKPRSSRR